MPDVIPPRPVLNIFKNENVHKPEKKIYTVAHKLWYLPVGIFFWMGFILLDYPFKHLASDENNFSSIYILNLKLADLVQWSALTNRPSLLSETKRKVSPQRGEMDKYNEKRGIWERTNMKMESKKHRPAGENTAS